MQERIRRILNNSFWKKLLKNVSIVLAGNGGSTIINFIVAVLMIRTLGNTQYGVFCIALQYMTVVDGVVNFQSWSGVIKYGSEALTYKNDKRLAAIFKNGFMIDIITAVLGGIIAICVLPIICSILNWSEELNLLALLFSVEIIFHLEGTSVGILRLFDMFKYTATQAIVAALIKLALIGGYIFCGGKSLLIITALYVATDVIKHLMLVFLALKVLHKKFGIRRVLSASLKDIDKQFLRYTLWNNVGYTVDVPVRYFDIFIISLISVEMVAIYKTFKQILQVLSMLIHPISQAILPQFSELIALKKGKEALGKVYKLRNAILLVGLAAALLALLIGRPIFGLILGQEYADHLMLFEFMLVTQMITMSFVSIHPLFAALGKAKQDFIITLATNLLYMGCAFGLVHWIGVYGLIIAIFVQGISSIALKLHYAQKYIGDNTIST